VRRTFFLMFFAFAISGRVLGEEILLKDGTKIVGHMSGITSEKIEVETSYGKVQLNRSEIVSIAFPENTGAKKEEAASVKVNLPKIDESLNGTQYVNLTGKFTLTMPTGWMIYPELRKTPGTLAGLSSNDKTRFAMVVREDYPGSLESYREMTYLKARQSLKGTEQLSESKVTIDGQPAMLLYYRGILASADNLPVEFLAAIISSGNSYTKISTWCVEPLFHDVQSSFEKIVNSYHSTATPVDAKSKK